MKHSPNSCDTMVVLGSDSASGRNIFAKNSDRPVDECQLLKYFPAADHAPGSKVKCNYIEVVQVPHTYACIGSQPWWLWGFEHGINEWGVAIGNEAEWSTIPAADKDALLGMDIIRLALERSRTAKDAVDVITFMIQVYGQGGPCRYGTSGGDYNYHNSFLVADKTDAYLVETLQNHWAYKKLDKHQAISNVYTLADDYDEYSEGILNFALEHDCYKMGTTFDFSKSFQLLSSAKCGGYVRAQRANKLLDEKAGSIDIPTMAAIMRDHLEGEFIENRWSPCSPYVQTICMHGSGKINEGSQTAATMIIEYHDNNYKPLAYTYWGSVCPPCCSLLVPFFNTGYIPEALTKGNNRYSEDSYWWQVKYLLNLIEADYNVYHPLLKEKQQAYEAKTFVATGKKVQEAKLLLDLGREEEAIEVLNKHTEACFNEAVAIIAELTAQIKALSEGKQPQSYRDNYLYEQKLAFKMGAFKKII